MFLIISKFWVPKGFDGITIFPFILARNKFCAQNTQFLNHERIHLKQQIEMLVIFFFIWYGIEFLIRRFQRKSFREAYRNISFEREAYANESDSNYLKQRRHFSFLSYI